MIEFNLISENLIEFDIDSEIYNDNVVTKVIYWLSADYLIFQEKINNRHKIKIQNNSGSFGLNEFLTLRSRINQQLIDFKTRYIINQETKGVREILLIKAFANNDDFEDYNLLTDNNE